jgi:hypothetical protein
VKRPANGRFTFPNTGATMPDEDDLTEIGSNPAGRLLWVFNAARECGFVGTRSSHWSAEKIWVAVLGEPIGRSVMNLSELIKDVDVAVTTSSSAERVADHWRMHSDLLAEHLISGLNTKWGSYSQLIDLDAQITSLTFLQELVTSEPGPCVTDVDLIKERIAELLRDVLQARDIDDNSRTQLADCLLAAHNVLRVPAAATNGRLRRHFNAVLGWLAQNPDKAIKILESPTGRSIIQLALAATGAAASAIGLDPSLVPDPIALQAYGNPPPPLALGTGQAEATSSGEAGA